MSEKDTQGREDAIGTLVLGATRSDGGTRKIRHVLGGETGLPFIGDGKRGHKPLVAFEICDDPEIWPQVIADYAGDIIYDTEKYASAAERDFGADFVRLYLTSTKRSGFDDFTAITETVEGVLGATGLPLIIEGSNEPAIDSEVFRRCGEAGQGERLLLGTAEADHYRSVAAAALAFGHAMIAQTPIDINLAKQLNILLREVGVPHDSIMIDPYTGALGYGYEYSYSVMERIRFSALRGDRDLAMPMISSAIDSLNVREVREADPAVRYDMAVMWELYAAISSAVAGAAIVCVRHPRTVPMLKEAICALWGED